jgi:hypothetical protein
MNITADAFKDLGINDLRSHVMLLKCQMPERLLDKSGTGTFLISRSPFTFKDINTVDSLCSVFDFEKILMPSAGSDSIFAKLTNENKRDEFNKNLPIDISSPTDDKPFFFHYMDYSDIMYPQMWEMWDLAFNVKAIFIVLTLAGTMLILSILCIIVPLVITKKRIPLKGSSGLFLFFMAIGVGFMMIEISQIQRLSIFLGHPTYSLSAALFTILLSSGIGSYLSGSGASVLNNTTKLKLIILLAVLILFGFFTPSIIKTFSSSTTEVRILVSVIILFPMGLFLGMAFPIGMKLASEKYPEITPWLWGINGVMSVMATVLSIIVSLKYGISISYWAGAVCYLLAFLTYLSISRNTNSKLN